MSHDAWTCLLWGYWNGMWIRKEVFAVFLPLRSPNRRSPESSAVYHYTSAGVYRTVSGFNAHVFFDSNASETDRCGDWVAQGECDIVSLRYVLCMTVSDPRGS